MSSTAFTDLGYAPSAAAEFVRQGIQLADNARHQSGKLDASVLFSCGSYGASLRNGAEYRGHFNVGEQTLQEHHRWRLQAAMEGDAARLLDGVVFETLPETAEAKALLSLLREFPDLRGKVWLAFACKSPTELCSGENFRQCVAEVLRADAHDKYISGVGVNCSPISTVQGLVCQPPLLHWLLSPTCPSSLSLRKIRDVIGEQLRVLCYPNNEVQHNERTEISSACSSASSPSITCQTSTPSTCCSDSSSSSMVSCKGEEPVEKQTQQTPLVQRNENGAVSEGSSENHQKRDVCTTCNSSTKWQYLARSALQWLHSGETMAVGGCCGTRPFDIQQIAEAVHAFNASSCL